MCIRDRVDAVPAGVVGVDGADDGDDVGDEFAVVDVGEAEVESVEVAHLVASSAVVMAVTVGQG